MVRNSKFNCANFFFEMIVIEDFIVTILLIYNFIENNYLFLEVKNYSDLLNNK